MVQDVGVVFELCGGRQRGDEDCREWLGHNAASVCEKRRQLEGMWSGKSDETGALRGHTGTGRCNDEDRKDRDTTRRNRDEITDTARRGDPCTYPHSRFTAGLILATFRTSSRSCGRKLLTPSEAPLSVPSSTSDSRICQNTAILPWAGTKGEWMRRRSGMKPSLEMESVTEDLMPSGVVGAAGLGGVETRTRTGW